MRNTIGAPGKGCDGESDQGGRSNIWPLNKYEIYLNKYSIQCRKDVEKMDQKLRVGNLRCNRYGRTEIYLSAREPSVV